MISPPLGCITTLSHPFLSTFFVAFRPCGHISPFFSGWSSYTVTVLPANIGSESFSSFGSFMALMPATTHLSPYLLASTTYLPGYPSMNWVSSHAVGTVLSHSISMSGISVRLFGCMAIHCTDVWFVMALAISSISEVYRRCLLLLLRDI